MKNGRDDDSLSNQRAIFVCQLIHAHYPHAEIRALAQHFTNVLASQPARFVSDIDNLLQRYTPTDYTSEPTRSRASALPPAPPRGGRHYKVDPMSSTIFEPVFRMMPPLIVIETFDIP